MKITQIILVDDSGKTHLIDLPEHHNVAISSNIRQVPIFIDGQPMQYDTKTDNVFTLISCPMQSIPMDEISNAIQKIINKK